MQREGPTLRGGVGALLLALGATALALAAAEVGVRLLPAAPEPPPPPLAAEYRDLPELTNVQSLLRPGTRGVFKGVLHRINSGGARGPEYSAWPAPGTFRIVVAGDSYTMGQGVEEQDTYTAVAAALLEARSDGRRYEVINLGVAGFAIRHSMRRLERFGLAYQPHLLVYGFTPNDIFGEHYREPSPEDQAAARALVERFEQGPSALLRMLWPRLVLAKSAWRPIPGTYEHALEQNYFENPAAWQQVADGLDELARLAGVLDACGLVFVHTRMNQLWIHPFTRIYEHVAAAARERGLFAGLSLSFLRGHDVAELRHSLVDNHPNAAGHRLHAEALVAGIDALPPECLAPASFR